jgi:hypothetical protein
MIRVQKHFSSETEKHHPPQRTRAEGKASKTRFSTCKKFKQDPAGHQESSQLLTVQSHL